MIENKPDQGGLPDNDNGLGGKRKRHAFLLPATIGVAAVVIIVTMRPPCGCGARSCGVTATQPPGAPMSASAVAPSETAAVATDPLPRLVDLGAGKCIACKKMTPILEELKKQYAGVLDVEFIDVWENQDQARKYGIQLIPTQIFFDRDGTERFRHEGFLAKEDILKKWRELDVTLTEENEQ